MKALAARIKARARRTRDALRLESIYEKYRTFTMIDRGAYVSNLRIVRQATAVPGCVVECGVWRGGMIAGMTEILGADREYLLFDSFEGLPPPKEIDGHAAMEWRKDTAGPHYHDNCRAEIEHARKAMQMSRGVNHKLIRGWFCDTLANFKPPAPIAVLRLDGDWYDSTMACLDALFPHVTKGGLVIIDDYYTWDGCSRAVHDYLSRRGLSVRIRQMEGVCVLIADGTEPIDPQPAKASP